MLHQRTQVDYFHNCLLLIVVLVFLPLDSSMATEPKMKQEGKKHKIKLKNLLIDSAR